jgi:competence transcription factor ComK
LKLSQMFCWNLYYNTVWIQYLITQKRTRIISKTVKQTIFNTNL